jgi:hypothetical protein
MQVTNPKDSIPQSQIWIEVLEKITDVWYDGFPEEEPKLNKKSYFLTIALLIHYHNYYQWIREEKVRKIDNALEAIARLKWEIDRSNVIRSELIGDLDKFCISKLGIIERNEFGNLMLNSETLGQMVDRCSIMILKIHFIKKCIKAPNLDGELRFNGQARLNILTKQIIYVSKCYDNFLMCLMDGNAYMYPYKQIKMYTSSDLISIKQD